MLAAWLFAPLLALVAQAGGESQESLVIRIHPFGLDQRFERRETESDCILPVVPRSWSGWEREAVRPPDLGKETWAGVAGDAVTAVVEPGAWHVGGRMVDMTTRFDLFVVAEPQLQDRVARVLDHLRRGLGDTMGIGILVYEIPNRQTLARAAEAAGNNDAEALAALAREGVIREATRFVLRVRSGEPFEAHSGERVGFVRDLDAYIAQASALHRPVPEVLETGTTIWGYASRDPSGGAAVDLALRHVWLEGDVQEIDCRPRAYVVGDGLERLDVRGRLQSPPVAFCTLRGRARLEQEGDRSVLFAGFDDGRGPVAVAAVVSLERLEPYEPVLELPGDVALAVVDASARVIEPPLPDIRGNVASIAHVTPPDDGDPLVALPTDVECFERLANCCAWVDPDIQSLAQPVALGTRIVSFGPAGDVRRAVRLTLDQLPPQAVRRVRLDSVRSGPVVSLPVGRAGGFAVAGRQRLVLTSWDVEVANNAAIADPETRFPLDGFVFEAVPTSPGPVDVFGLWHLRLDEGRTLSDRATTGLLHSPRFAEATLRGLVETEGDVGGLPEALGGDRFVVRVLGED